MDLVSLFSSAFFAATILPGGSEFVLVLLDLSSYRSFWTLWLVATLGNTLGGLVSYFMGRIIPESKTTQPSLQTGIARVQRYGSPILLLSWVPIIGDVLCVAAGWLRINLRNTVIFIGLGKAARYAAVLLFV